jgi:hypothetical protein
MPFYVLTINHERLATIASLKFSFWLPVSGKKMGGAKSDLPKTANGAK